MCALMACILISVHIMSIGDMPLSVTIISICDVYSYGMHFDDMPLSVNIIRYALKCEHY